MLQPEPQISEVGDEFPTVESFKKVAQKGAKVAGFAFNILLLKVFSSGKGDHTPYITLQCIMRALYKLEEKYDYLNDSGSKTTFLHKIEALVSEEIVILKASLPNASKKHPTST
ncbi:1119_t:CDS:2, partial [Cetraspora pellucida]